ncbi:MAG: bacillithiol system redox-active protein YtxJ [bacterium]|nr:bacillithiol system redox-active protein YtxJ [bacterium]
MENFIQPTSLDEIVDGSKESPVLIFKHSLTCPISAGAYNRTKEGLEKGLIPYPVYLVIVQKDKELSSQIAKDLDVVHESPQLILVKDGKAVYHASHGAIQVQEIPNTLVMQ